MATRSPTSSARARTAPSTRRTSPSTRPGGTISSSISRGRRARAAEAAVSRPGGKGFTLIELLVVLAIIAGGAVLLLPHLAKPRGDLVLRAETRRVGRLVRVTQAEALATHGDVSLRSDVAKDTLTAGNEKLVEKLRVDLVSVEPPGDLVFSADGGPSAETTYRLADADGRTASVTVSAGTGRVVYGP